MAKEQILVKPKKKKNGVGQYILGFFLALYTLFCAAPVVLTVISAFTDDKELKSSGFTYFPQHWSMAGMNAVLRYGKQLGTSYGVTIFVTVVGTFVGLLVMSMFAYSLSRPQFRMRYGLSIYLLIPMLFNGGQLSSYVIFTGVYHLKDSILLLILPICVTTMNVIILRTYIQNSIPEEADARRGRVHDGDDLLERLAERLSVHRIKEQAAAATPSDQNSEVHRDAAFQQEHPVCRHRGDGRQHPAVVCDHGNRHYRHRAGHHCLSVLPEILCQRTHGRVCQGLTG